MAHALTAGTAPTLNTKSFFAPIVNFFASLKQVSEKQRILNELKALDDRMLDDIGLNRGDLADWNKSGVTPVR